MLLDEKAIVEIEERAKRYIKEGVFAKEKDSRFVSFFLSNSRNSLDVAKMLFEASTKQEMKDKIGMPDFNGFLWVINSSYYFMFYMSRALLEKNGIRIKGRDYSIHSLTFDALVHYFYLTKKLERGLMESFAESVQDSAQALGREKAKELMENYSGERNKRSQFTYEMGMTAIEGKAKTSLERAKKFSEELRRIIEIP